MKIIRCMVPEIKGTTNRVFFCQSFLTFDLTNNRKNQNFEKIKKILGDIIILHLCITNDDRIMYGPWDIVHDRYNFPFLGTFFVLKNENHIMYGSWDMERDRQNFLSFWTIFYSFTPLTAQKIFFLQK